MPVFHSAFNQDKTQVACNAAVLPLKTKVKGPAPPAKADAPDIVDEAIELFRANVLYRNFKPEGGADLTLCYLTVYISELLRFMAKYANKTEARKNVTQVSMSDAFSMPGDKGFPLPGFFQPSNDRNEMNLFRGYFRQLREECANRLLETVFNADESKNKWWFQFSKRKFMNVDKT